MSRMRSEACDYLCDIRKPLLNIESSAQLKRLINGGVSQSGAGLKVPKHVGDKTHVTFLGVTRGGLAHKVIEAENLWQQHQTRPAAVRGCCYPGAELPVRTIDVAERAGH